MLCKFIYHNKDSCSKESIKDKKFCKIQIKLRNPSPSNPQINHPNHQHHNYKIPSPIHLS